MKHGGPDNGGIYYDESISLGLGHRRLSIIDLTEAGNQPMQSNNGLLTLIFNGEIYNFPDLKNDLEHKGHHFNTHSDTEVILAAYQYWGSECFAKFRGMFALAIYDSEKNKIILARDHAGIKPLYYFFDKQLLYFASEIRAFKKLDVSWEEDKDWKIFFLTYGYLPSNATTLKGVKPLEKGSFITIDIASLTIKQSFFLQDHFTEEIKDLHLAKELIKEALDNSVKRHLIADAPIGLFLSGGIDSSLLTILAKKHKPELHTLSIIFDDENYSEKKFQDIIAKKVGSKHQSFLLNKEVFISSLPDILLAMDQPSSDGINSYFISKFAKEAGLKAVLSGLGADELFGGYSSFSRGELISKIKRFPSLIHALAAKLPQDKYRKINFLKNKDLLGDYLFSRGYYTPLETAKLLDIDVKEVLSVLNSTPIPAFVNTLSEGNKTSYFESNLYMEGQLLKDTDIMSMWHSIEVRVPFLDYDFTSLVHRISSNLKFDNRQSKFLLIESFKDILPEEIWNRKKQGFVFPFDVWMKDYTDNLATDKNSIALNKRFKAGNLTWSRYWTYLVSQSFKA